MIAYERINDIEARLQEGQPITVDTLRETIIELIVSVHELNDRVERIEQWGMQPTWMPGPGL